MKIFSSQSASAATPDSSSETLSTDSTLGPTLKSRILSSNSYLKRLARNSISVGDIHDANTQAKKDAIRKIKLALNLLHDHGVYGDSNTEKLNDNNSDWNANVETNIALFQVDFALNATGLLDRDTLVKIDDLLTSLETESGIETYVDNSFSYVGKLASPKEVGIKFVTAGQSTSVYLADAQGKTYQLELSGSQLENFKMIIKSDDTSLQERIGFIRTAKLNAISAANELPKSEMFYLSSENIRLAGLNGEDLEFDFDIQTLQSVLDEIPFNPLGSDMATLHRVGPGETAVSIVRDYYYNQPGIRLGNPFAQDTAPPNSTFEIPPASDDPQQFPNYNIQQDIRMKFYLNLLYYYNTDEGTSNNENYGILSQGYTPHNPDIINNINIFDNKFDGNDPTSPTAYPNYKRFLDVMEAEGSSIEFDGTAVGSECTTFQVVENKFLQIPSRRFADSLFYHVNFRHYEMLENFGTPNETYRSNLDDFFDGLDQNTLYATNSYEDSQYKGIFDTCLNYFRKGLEWLIPVIVDNWPRGIGLHGQFTGDLTVAAPINADIIAKGQMYRKMTKESEVIIVHDIERESNVGLDIGLGFSVGGSLGFNSGTGKKRNRKQIGTGAFAAGLEVDFLKQYTNETYEYPVNNPRETKIIAALIASLFEDTASGMSGITLSTHYPQALSEMNTETEDYLVRLSTGIGKSFGGFAAAQLKIFDNDDFDSDKSLKLRTDPDPEPTQTDRKTFSRINNIMEKLPSGGQLFGGGGLSVNLNTEIGSRFIYERKFRYDSYYPERESRIPVNLKIENYYFAEGSLSSGFLGNFIQKYLLNLTIGGFFNLLSFDLGFGIGISYEWSLPSGAPRDLTYGDFDSSSVQWSNPMVVGEEADLILPGGWKSSMRLGLYSGNLENICESGHEHMLKMDVEKIFNLLKNGNSIDFTDVDTLIGYFKSYSFRYKLANGLSNLDDSKIADSVVSSFNKSGQPVVGSISTILESARETVLGFDFGAGVMIGMEFSIADILPVFRYYFNLTYLEKLPDTITYKVRADLVKERGRAIRAMQVLNITGQSFYTTLYNALNNYLTQRFSSELSSANYLNQFIAFSTASGQYLSYLVGAAAGSENEENRISQSSIHGIIHALVGASNMGNVSLSVEAKVGLGASGSANLKLGLVTLKLLLGAQVAIMANVEVAKDGNIVELEPGDPLRAPLARIDQIIFGNILFTSPDGMRTSLLKPSSISGQSSNKSTQE